MSERLIDRSATSLRIIRSLWAIAPTSSRVAGTIMVTLGLLSGFLGSLGVSLVLLLIVESISAQPTVAPGFLGIVFATVRRLTGGSLLGLTIATSSIVISTYLVNGAYSLLEATVRNNIHHLSRTGIFRQYLTQPYEEVAKKDYGELLNTLQVESWYVSEAVTQGSRIVINVSTILVYAVVILATSWPVALAASTSSVIFMLIVRFAHLRLRKAGERATVLKEELSDQTISTIQALRTIRLFAAESRQILSYNERSDAVRRVFISLAKIEVAVRPVAEVTSLLLIGVLVWLSSYIGNSVSTTLALVGLVYRLQPNVRELEHNIMALSGMQGSLKRVLDALETSGSDSSANVGKEFPGLKEGIRMEGITYSYPGAHRPAVQNVSLELPRSSLTALIGPSGAGKTTVVNLLLGLFHPQSGQVTVDGTLLSEFSSASWLSRIGISGQDVELLEGSILDNLRLGRPEASETEALKALELAGIIDYLRELPDGLETRVGDRGLRLSGGQRQRIALARALIAEPDLLVLDEATNAIDSALERNILSSIRRAHPQMTILLIAHRGSATVDADQVAIIDNGAVIETGTPEQLLQRPGSLFNALFDPGKPSGALH